ncbi:MAG: class II fructose-bisphosphate aldolase [Gammaproteobacteria bacterium]|nr:class II fructose-bisphosphate aldolase [Gammaproteobacteria bacterium]MDH5728317.1 class II fructose-bisphosphate aldolase [Gammaproteobacteria bacterium]
MALVDMRDLLYHAYNNRYAVGAFEIASLDFLNSVIQAAEVCRSPVILNVIDQSERGSVSENLMAAIDTAARSSSIPVAVHYDHCINSERVEQGIRLGCNGVMLDASDKSFPENVEYTKKAVELAHSCGIPVEGSLGEVSCAPAQEDSNVQAEPKLTSVPEVEAYIKRTGIDFLAISIGTVHGRSNSKSKLDFGRLGKINAMAGIPLVIHGGTGLSESQYHKLIDNGVAKINYFTALDEVAMAAFRISSEDQTLTSSELMMKVRSSLSNEVSRCMQAWRSAGRAAEVMMQCSSWHNVEQVIVYNSENSDPQQIQQMIQNGKHELSRIPGVLNVKIGKSLSQNGKFQYCWIIRLASQSVLKTYKKDPHYLSYTNNFLKKQATDQIDDDYEMLNDFESTKTVAGHI